MLVFYTQNNKYDRYQKCTFYNKSFITGFSKKFPKVLRSSRSFLFSFSCFELFRQLFRRDLSWRIILTSFSNYSEKV
jgi:hypothetical protein